jgi:hypothetical protein
MFYISPLTSWRWMLDYTDSKLIEPKIRNSILYLVSVLLDYRQRVYKIEINRNTLHPLTMIGLNCVEGINGLFGSWSYYNTIPLSKHSTLLTSLCGRYSLPMQADKRGGENQIRKKRGPASNMFCVQYAELHCKQFSFMYSQNRFRHF